MLIMSISEMLDDIVIGNKTKSLMKQKDCCF